MPDPCQQEAKLGRLEATTEQIGQTLERLLDVLERVATQGTRIDHLSTGQDLLFTRVRDMELSAESQKVKVGIFMGFISMVTSAVTAFIVKHFSGGS
jgi:siroheme synthase